MKKQRWRITKAKKCCMCNRKVYIKRKMRYRSILDSYLCGECKLNKLNGIINTVESEWY